MAQTRKEQLEAALQKAAALNRIATSTDYTQYLKPYLDKLSYIPPIDSAAYKTDEEYIHALKENNLRTKLYRDLVLFLDQQEGVMKRIREELEKPTKSHGI